MPLLHVSIPVGVLRLLRRPARGAGDRRLWDWAASVLSGREFELKP